MAEGKQPFTLGGIISFLMMDFLADSAVKAAKDGLKDGLGSSIKAKVEKATKSTAESRAEMFAFIQGPLEREDPDAVRGLMLAQTERQGCKPARYAPNKRYMPGSEDKMIRVLTDLFRYLSDQGEECDRMIAFQDLGHAALDNPEQFDASIEMLIDDKFGQYAQLILIGIKKAGVEIKRGAAFAKKIAPEIPVVAGKVLKTADDAAGKAATGINSLVEKLRKV